MRPKVTPIDEISLSILGDRVMVVLEHTYDDNKLIPTVENIQDVVEKRKLPRQGGF